MSANSSRPNLKRPFSDDGDDASAKPPMQKKVRFPKGKKVRLGHEPVERGRDESEAAPVTDPRVAAKERAKRRSQITTELFGEDSRGIVKDISTAEVAYEDDDDFVQDGIQIEPFNLKQEREEGYFDADMNFVEFVNEKEIKDAWLDSLEVDPKYAGKVPNVTTNDNDAPELSSSDIGKIKRRIADILEPGETVLQALRRLKGNSNNRKDKMSSETKVVFDQLTEDAVKLMESGEYDVYHEKKEIFEREAEKYESLARLRVEGLTTSAGQGYFDSNSGKDALSGLTDTGIVPSGSVNPLSDSCDMFADDDEQTTANPSSSERNLVSGATGIDQPVSNSDSNSESGALGSDYVYDETSGYYYSSSLCYYYDPSTGLYCSAASGQWYSFNEETGAYDEIPAAASTVEEV
ncbi:hypothetical protein L484_017210 [Morus notabilis]|uniref:OCRE domain-containing protein n=1 Tax=Morus notabilis TaxID=981085 RepID=W9QVS4_9ROSA|nr:uncharacterized protein LOC21400216 [Morus notabilis]EXB55299.1 hypothetical protein L484_017210 [Morus notabilis]